MNRRILVLGKWTATALALLLVLALCGCSSAEQAEITVEKDFAETGLMQALAAKYSEDTGTEIVITAVSANEIQKLLDAGPLEQCVITPAEDDMAAYIEQNGLLGGEFCFDSLMLIAPLDDRAGVSQLQNVSGADVLKHIALTQSNFVHAPADSALGKIEQKLWKEAGIVPEGDWYISAGSDGLGILDEAQARNAYALVDRRSVALVSSEYVSLKVVQANLKGMASSYYALAPSPGEGGEDDPVQAFARWLFSDAAKAVISGYDVMADEPAFLPGNAVDYNPALPTPAPEPTIIVTPDATSPDASTTETEQPSGEQPSTEQPSTPPEADPSPSQGEESTPPETSPAETRTED